MFHTLLIHQAFVSPQEPGGTRHYEFARHVTDEGDQFTIITSTLSYLTGKSIGKQGETDLDGIRLIRTYTYPNLHKSFIWRVYAFLTFMFSSLWAGLTVKKVDVVMGTSPPIFQACSAWLIAKLRRKPFLLEIRDLWPEFGIEMGVLKNPILIKASRWLEMFLYHQSQHLLVNSPAYATYLMNKGIPKQKIHFIPNGVDPSMFEVSSISTDFRTIWGVQNRFVVVYAGALGMANDLQTVVEAASLLPSTSNSIIIIVGDGKERHNLERMAQKLQTNRIKFVGSIPKEQMRDVLSAADVCLASLQNIPMFTTTYPNKVFDYLAARKPVILGIDGVIRDVVEAGQAGLFVPPGDSEAIVRAIQELEVDQVKAKQMGENGFTYVKENFNRKHHAKAFRALLNAMVAPKKA